VEEISVECHPKFNMMTDSILYVWDAQSGESLQQEFAEKIAGIVVTGNALSGEGVAPVGTEQRDPVWRSSVRYNAQSGTGEIIWTITMKNGDVIVLSHRMVVSPYPTIIIDSENSELNTSASLQAALDALTPEDLEKKFIIINLPGGQYTEPVVFPAGRYEVNAAYAISTQFKGGLTILGGEVTCNGIWFWGNGGTGITANGHVMLYDCTVIGWDTGVLVNDGAWAAVHRSVFKNNGIGLHFNSKRSNFYNETYDLNQFVGNETAFLLENVPMTPPLSFPGTLFFENGQDFDNRCGKKLDLSLARMEVW